MRDPTATVKKPPITVSQLRGIIAGLGVRYEKLMPCDDTLTKLAVVLTARHPRYDHTPEQQWEAFGPLFHLWPPEVEFPVHTIDVRGNKYTLKAPLFHPKHIPFDWDKRAIGHPCYAKSTTWGDIALDLVDEFHGAMGQTFDLRGAPARFLEKVIPLITRETPSARTIAQRLVWLRSRQRKGQPPPWRKRIR
jgi:hypothetical protein